MNTQSKSRRAAAFVLASAVALTALAGAAQADPQPGTCKTAMEVGIANSPAGAQQMWTATVQGKFGAKWAHWVGAKHKSLTLINNGTYYQALGKPCFYQPVL